MEKIDLLQLFNFLMVKPKIENREKYQGKYRKEIPKETGETIDEA